jgi:predicted adenylyl cyclase CyaB
MKHTNYEFKARLRNEDLIRAALRRLRARHVGTDRQVDTYFRVASGRLKVREGKIENGLIYYDRADTPRARSARIEMMFLPRRNSVRSILARSLDVLVVVRKRREIYFVGNVKIHLDRVHGLGRFVEVEAVSRSKGLAQVRAQARKYQKLFGISRSDLVAESYSDLVLRKLKH